MPPYSNDNIYNKNENNNTNDDQITVMMTSRSFQRQKNRISFAKSVIENIQNKPQPKQSAGSTGLDIYVNIESEMCQRKRKNIIRAVLEEQDFQRKLGISEPEIIASISKLNSCNSKTLAQSVAIQNYNNMLST